MSFFSCSLYGQTSYLRKIEKGKFGKAEKKINKALKKEPNDLVLNYAMSILLMKRKYKDYNTAKSYEYLTKAERLYANIDDETQINKLNKIPINSSVILNHLDTICIYALDDAIETNTVESFENFILKYPKANQISEAISKRNALAYSRAMITNTIS